MATTGGSLPPGAESIAGLKAKLENQSESIEKLYFLMAAIIVVLLIALVTLLITTFQWNYSAVEEYHSTLRQVQNDSENELNKRIQFLELQLTPTPAPTKNVPIKSR